MNVHSILLMLGSLASLVFNQPTNSAYPGSCDDIQAAFIRDGDLWSNINGHETQVTHGLNVSSPQWSYDGEWVSYIVTKDPAANSVMNTLHVRNITTNKDTIAFYFRDDTDCETKWAPDRNILAFRNQSILNDIDMKNVREQGFRNISLGVREFSWLPDGRGFLVSSSANALPDGWTNVNLYTIPLTSAPSLVGTAQQFYTLPKEVGVAGTKVLTIGTSTLKWSPDGKWIAFIVHPTASWSADSNILCVLSSDKKSLIPVAEMLNRDDWFDWAPRTNQLAFIEGGGRFVTEGKHLAIASAPNFHVVNTFTPKGFVDNAFTWNYDTSLTVSRAREGQYKAKLDLQQIPSLYLVQVQDKLVRKITSPPVGFGDYQPIWHQKTRCLTWVRANAGRSSVWVSDQHALKPSIWIENVDREAWSPYWAMWKRLLDLRQLPVPKPNHVADGLDPPTKR